MERYWKEYNPLTGQIFTCSKDGRKECKYVGTRGYIRCSYEGKKVQGHRLAWFLHYGEWPEGNIDHINRVKTDNRICNLRIATLSENQFNSDRCDNATHISKHKNGWQVARNGKYYGFSKTYEGAVAIRSRVL